MTDHLHPQRETYPLVTSNDEFVSVCRSHIPPNMQPSLYIKALAPTSFRLDESKTLDERAGYQVLAFGNGATDTITLTVNGGAPTVLTEGADFDAVVSNAETALQIAAAINGASVGLIATTEVGQPYVYVAGDNTVQSFTLASSDQTFATETTLANIGTVTTLSKYATTILTLGTRDPLDTVGFLRVLSGSVSLELRSPVEVRTYLRQPATLSGNTGHPGGWPTSP